MYENFTTNDFILYYFNETEITESVLIQKKIDTCPEAETEFENIVNVMDHIDKIMIAPSASVLQQVFNYSKSIK